MVDCVVNASRLIRSRASESIREPVASHHGVYVVGKPAALAVHRWPVPVSSRRCESVDLVGRWLVDLLGNGVQDDYPKRAVTK